MDAAVTASNRGTTRMLAGNTALATRPRAASLALAAVLLMPAIAQARETACTELVKLDLVADGVRIDSADTVAAAAPGTVRLNPFMPPLASGLPAHCKVAGVINERTGIDGKTYGLGFEIALPQDWNGRFLFQSGGGLNGSINPPIGASAAGDVPALARGFAVVSTDGGHKGQAFDASFTVDQRATLDFAHSSVGTVTQVAKKIVAARYGRLPEHSYIAGCSTGGREGMLAMQRYPELFDGVVIGAPAMRTGFSNLGLAHATAMFNRAAPKDAAGKPEPARLYSSADKAVILQGLLAQCDAIDGLADGFIEAVAQCKFQPARLQCAKGQATGCLDKAQTDALADAFKAPRDAAGASLYVDFPYDTGIVFEGMGIPGFLPSAAPNILGAVAHDPNQSLDALARKVRADAMQMLTDTDAWTNLSSFLQRGGKALFYHGVSDPWFSLWDTLDYYQRAAQANGGEQAWADASRFYAVAGMGHCGGGTAHDQFDLLSAVVDWVEQGKPPQDAGIVAARRTADGKAATRPLCPWPTHAHYTGAGDIASADSYTCRTE